MSERDRVGDTDRERAVRVMAVSRETADRFGLYVDLLRRWQSVKNLIGPATLPQIWMRHIVDSHQLVALGGAAVRWADLGSGAGFPGLVVAIALHGRPGAEVHLIESNHRKAAFLRDVVRATGAPAVIHAARIEAVVPHLQGIEIVTARALAPLPRLLEWGQPLIDSGATGLFLKGEEFRTESATVQRDGNYAVDFIGSVTQADAAVVRVRASGPKG